MLALWFIGLPLVGVAAARWAASFRLSSGAAVVVLPLVTGGAIACTAMLLLVLGTPMLDDLADFGDPVLICALIWPAVTLAVCALEGFRLRPRASSGRAP